MLTDDVHMPLNILASGDLVEFLGMPCNQQGHVFFEIENGLVSPSKEPPGFHSKEDSSIVGSTATNVVKPDQLVTVNALPQPVTPVLVGAGLGAVLSHWCHYGTIGRATERREFRGSEVSQHSFNLPCAGPQVCEHRPRASG
jgi:hypothetical protein